LKKHEESVRHATIAVILFHANDGRNDPNYSQAVNPHAAERRAKMPKKIIPTETDPSEIYPDPLSKAKGAFISSQLADIALAGDIPASRLFSNLPAAIERDVWQEVRREREEMSVHFPLE
jgi:hypothetical protein